MRKVLDIYQQYKIVPQLQEHMLRVTAVASMICDNFSEPISKYDIITACLFHDMGNIIKFKMNVIPEFFEPDGVEYWQGVKDEYIKKYGTNEHEATMEIMREIGILENIIAFVGHISFPLICDVSKSNDLSTKIIFYADARVGPHGVFSYEERMEEGKKRYHKDSGMSEEEREVLVQCGRDIEKQIFEKCKIKPEDITDEAVVPIISELRNFMIN